jgi:hypothetical protein
MKTEQKTLLGILPAMDADVLASQLSKEGVAITTMFNHSSCNGGCAPSKEIWVHPADVVFIQQFMVDRHMRVLQEMGADLDQVNQVFDPSKPTAVCPACGTTFSTHQTQCPECDLVFS